MTETGVAASFSNTFKVVSVHGEHLSKHHITAHPEDSCDLVPMFRDVVEFVREKQARIIHQFVFGGSELHGIDGGAIEEEVGGLAWPVTWITGEGPSEPCLVGTQLMAMSRSVQVVPVELDGRIVGHCYEDDLARYCILGDIRPSDTCRSRPEQTSETFDNMNRALESVGMAFTDVARTWFYLDCLLDWYGPFNEVRTDFFRRHGVFEHMVPASTGIGAGNTSGAALVADLMAIRPKDNRVKVFAVPSPMQCPALDYKSSFSRAVEIDYPDHRRLYVSGTASIDPEGRTMYVDDIAGQIDLTMKVVEALMESRSMGWSDTKKAVTYLSRTEDVPVFEKYCRDRGIPDFPMVLAHTDICRRDLLFEIEVETVRASSKVSG